MTGYYHTFPRVEVPAWREGSVKTVKGLGVCPTCKLGNYSSLDSGRRQKTQARSNKQLIIYSNGTRMMVP